ncbi:hypothetical protein DSO57_1016463 [Entomophthora muscae]|uniref:Uncharacterized protein n=1 Tax=Entomophthora muscae TaxID=34485 RepID=A0ACC2U380_9FUNG|nr:hypothetical protein DSO57_1016463 [Entomophthora muscae]
MVVGKVIQKIQVQNILLLANQETIRARVANISGMLGLVLLLFKVVVAGRGRVVVLNDPSDCGSCSFGAGNFGAWVALNPYEFRSSWVCGICLEVKDIKTGNAVVARISDFCPNCDENELGIGGQVALELESTTGEVTWRQVRCPNSGNVVYKWRFGSNQVVAQFVVLNHAEGIMSIEAAQSNKTEFKVLDRTYDNYFILFDLNSPFVLRLNGTFGSSFVENALSISGWTGYSLGNGQF